MKYLYFKEHQKVRFYSFGQIDAIIFRKRIHVIQREKISRSSPTQDTENKTNTKTLRVFS